MRFEWLKFVYFSNFGLFLPNPKLIFSLCFGPVLNYWVSFSLFWVGFPYQYLLGLSNYFFLLKTRVIKLLIIYLILKIIKYINIYREGVVRCSLCGFLIIKLQTALHHAMCCGAVQDYLQCDAVMPSCRRFWCDFCSLVYIHIQTQTNIHTHTHKYIYT